MFGQKLVERYRAIEADALVATRKHLRDIEMALKTGKATRPLTSLKRTVRGVAARRSRAVIFSGPALVRSTQASAPACPATDITGHGRPETR